MKSTETCPKCSKRKFLVTATWKQPEWHSCNVTQPVVAVTLEYEPPKTTFGSGSRPTLGCFETWICLECGYTEFYARGLAGVEDLAKQHPEQLSIVDATPPEQGPYR
jgi:predicted nucleic-acid-binding Zn-ribbon protein